MIRANEFANTAALWSRPTAPAPSRTDARDATTWLDAGGDAEVSIGGSVASAARGLTVEQHASRVLMYLREDADRRA